MSAWMFDHEGMNRVIDAIVWAHANRVDPLGLDKYPTREPLGNELFEMNSKALYARYGNDPSYNDPPPGYVYSPSGADVVQLCKSLHCFRHQCAEGDVPSTDLFKAITAVMELLDKEIGYDDAWTREHPNYAKFSAAVWG